MTTRVIRVEVDSNGDAVCVVTALRADDQENPPAELSDLPLDFQRALRAWLAGETP